MASELKVDKFTGVTTAGSILVTGEGNSTTTNLQQGLVKAWSQHHGNGTVADSFNSSHMTDHGTADNTFFLLILWEMQIIVLVSVVVTLEVQQVLSLVDYTQTLATSSVRYDFGYNDANGYITMNGLSIIKYLEI